MIGWKIHIGKARVESVTNLYCLIGANIRSVRIHREMSQEKLAKKIGMSRTSVVNMEAGRQRILLETILDIATILNVLPTELLRRFRK